MTDPRAKYEEALAAFAQPGNRWGGLSALTYWGAACGMDAEAVTDAAHAAGVANRDAEIRAGVTTAAAKIAANAARWGRNAPTRNGGRNRRRAKPKPASGLVRAYIRHGEAVDTPDKLAWMSPVAIPPETYAQAHEEWTALQLCAMFDPGDIVRVRQTKEDNRPGAPGVNMGTAARLLDIGTSAEIVRVNPLTGERGQTNEGKPSFDANSCISSFRHVIMEFDDLPLADQCRFFAGFVRRSKLASHLVALVFSGAKSIHGVIDISATDKDEAKRAAELLREAYATDPERTYRLDEQALRPLTGVRLAGAVRRDTGLVQRLLYVRDRFRMEPPFHVRRREDAKTRTEPGATESQQPSPGAKPATVREPRIPPPPDMPDGNAPLDDILAAVDAYESWEAAGYADAWANRHACV